MTKTGNPKSLSAAIDSESEILLGRSVFKSDLRFAEKFIKNKSIIITGAAGSIGSEIVRQVSEFGPKILICLDWWENGLYDLELELRKKFPTRNLKFVIANIQDRGRIEKCFYKYHPEIVFDAAAYKHVPIMESNLTEAIKNNVLATFELARISIKNNVEKFILLSTDKAVNPVSIMGVSKLLAENILYHFNKKKKTKFISVRFCNVLNSYGSVVPIFKKQIMEGGPITITDPQAVRYFMSISEAVELIIQALVIGQGGEIFLLDSAQPLKIIDLARELIKLYHPTKKIEIEIVGLRPGEKLSEESLIQVEGVTSTNVKRIFLMKNNCLDSGKLLKTVERLKKLTKSEDETQIIEELKKTFKSYHPSGSKARG